jgi:G:T/U-mismatch repair DNA glycosylase
VLAACEREGSLDSAIRNPAANDFDRVRHLCPVLETVGFNGQVSGQVRAAVRGAGGPDRGAAVVAAGAHGAQLRARASGVAKVGGGRRLRNLTLAVGKIFSASLTRHAPVLVT